jgi:transcriptional regulator with XRE-family HTH domain
MKKSESSKKVAGAKVAGVSHSTVLARQMKDPDFRYHYEQRKLVHEVAVAVRAMRKQAGLTQAQLASKVGVSQPMIAKIEKGIEQRTPHFDMLGKICVALGKQIRLSFHDVEDEEAQPHMVEVDGRPAPELEVQAGAGEQ